MYVNQSSEKGGVNPELKSPETGTLSMPRPMKPDLIKKWKISLPATLAGTVEYLLRNPVTGKPVYGSQSKLVESLLIEWVEKQGITKIREQLGMELEENEHAAS